MTATEELKHEHRAIEIVLRVLEAIATRLQAGQPVDVLDLDQIIEFIRVFADRCHHGKEEDLLFPVLIEAGIPVEGGPIGVMLLEHTIGRNCVANLTAAVERYRTGSAGAGEAVAESARAYIDLLTKHIAKEDSILYVMADARLLPAQQQELLRQFEKLEEEKIGHGKHEEFHRLIDRLKAAYLK